MASTRKPRPPAPGPQRTPAAAPSQESASGTAARPRSLERGAGGRKAAPSARALVPASGTVALEDVLVGFQRSLARATRSSLETARADWQVGLGQRSLYVVDSIGVTLQAGVIAALDADGQVQSLSLDLGERAGTRVSTLEFRVQARPIEAIAGEQLTLADTDPLGHARPRHRMRFTLVGRHDGGGAAVARPQRTAPPAAAARSKGAPGTPDDAVQDAPAAPSWVPLADCELTVFVVGGDGRGSETFTLRTNLAGQADLQIDAAANTIEFGGGTLPLQTLDLRSHGDDFFVYGACAPQRTAGGVVGGHLSSNVVQFRVLRQARPAVAKKGRR